MNENAFQSQMVHALKTQGAMVLNLHGHAMQAPGWPDLYVAHPKWRGWIELKVKGRALSELQEVIIRKLMERGDTVYVMDLTFGTVKIWADLDANEHWTVNLTSMKLDPFREMSDVALDVELQGRK